MSDPKFEGPKRTSLWWTVGPCALVGIALFSYLFQIAGITLIPGPLPVTGPPLDPSSRGQVIAAAITWLGGVGALITFLLNRDQKERHLLAQLSATRQLENQRRDQDKEFELSRDKRERDIETERMNQERLFEEERKQRERDIEATREKRERDLAELQRLESEFAALVQAFASTDPLTQISAAIGLGELARRPDPRLISFGNDLPDFDEEYYSESFMKPHANDHEDEAPYSWQEDWRTRKTERNYPYFRKAVDRLAIGLSLYSQTSVRSEVSKSIKYLATWAADPGTDEPLLYLLVNRLADVNRHQWNHLKANYVTWSASGHPRDTLENLALAAGCFRRTVDSSEVTFENSLLELFIDHLEISINDPKDMRRFLWQVNDDILNAEISTGAMQTAFSKLWESRDTLAFALRKLSAPPDIKFLSTPSGPLNLRNHPDRSRPFGRELRLEGVMLFMCNLQGAQLQHSTLSRAYFVGADLGNASLVNSVLRQVKLIGASVGGTNLSHCRIVDSDLTLARGEDTQFQSTYVDLTGFLESKLFKARFDSSEISRSRFGWSDLGSANFEDSTLSLNDFQSASLIDARFRLAEIQGCSFERACLALCDFKTATKFDENVWEHADFVIPTGRRGVRTGQIKYDEVLWNLLNEMDPVIEGQDPRVAPWDKPDSSSA